MENTFVVTGNLSNSAFGDLIKHRILVKDSFAPEHGEFSHTFQWLAGAIGLGWGKDTASYYGNTIEYGSQVPLVSRRGRDAYALENISLWSWLVDCFPEPKKDGESQDLNLLSIKRNDGQGDGPAKTEKKDDLERKNILSSSFRVPNHVWTLAQQKSRDWFIGCYVARRLQSILTYQKEGQKDEYFELQLDNQVPPQGVATKNPAQRPRIQAIKSFQSAKYTKRSGDAGSGWQAYGQKWQFALTTNPSEIKETPRNFVRSLTFQGKPRENEKLVRFKFHGIEGDIPAQVLNVSG